MTNFEVALSVPGWFLATSLQGRDKVPFVSNVQNYGLSVSNIGAIKESLFMLSSNIEFLPTSMLGVLVGGMSILNLNMKGPSRLARILLLD